MRRSHTVCGTTVLIAMLISGASGLAAASSPTPTAVATPIVVRIPTAPTDVVARLIYRVQVMARAADAMTRRHPMDYERPFDGLPYDESEAKWLYLEGCQLGDRPACWISAGMDHWRSTGAARALVLEHCRAGDMLSCRALPDLPLGDVPGAAGRSRECLDPLRDPAQCDLAAVRRECAAGFPQSCWRLREDQAAQETPDRAAHTARALELSRKGCDVFILQECDLLRFYGVGPDAELGTSHECPFVRSRCPLQANVYLARGDRAGARDAAERECQYDVGSRDDHNHSEQHISCLELALAYSAHDYVEPVAGRGEALMEWACGSTALRQISKECKAYVAKQELANKH